jgi:hypothetical protein
VPDHATVVTVRDEFTSVTFPFAAQRYRGGAGCMAVRRDVLADVVPHVANWFGAEEIWSGLYGLPLRLAGDGRRLDLSPAWFPQRGAAISLPWLAKLNLNRRARTPRGTRGCHTGRLGPSFTRFGDHLSGNTR